MYNDDPRHGGELRHDTRDPKSWGAEMLGYLRDDDQHFERWRHEELGRLDEQYRAWRHEHPDDDFGRWRTEYEQRTGRAMDEPTPTAQPEPDVAMPLSGADMPGGGGVISPDAEAPRHKEALQSFHTARAESPESKGGGFGSPGVTTR